MVIPVVHGTQYYDIVLSRGLLAQAGAHLNLERKALIVTDDGVPAQYARTIAAQCRDPLVITLAQGEASKSFAQYEQLLSAMLQASFTRADCVIAVGGGVVGDLSGFAAASYMRGIDFYNIPTTLLSQVDSSIGGKTAINFEGIKNVIGAFYPPKKVLIDPDTLDTLSPRQLHAGLAEVIKMALTCDSELFSMLEQGLLSAAQRTELIFRALQIKKQVVQQDPTEAGLRRVLNFGHTIGHAIEGFYGGQLLHGECVALGMLPMCSRKVRAQLLPVLQQYELPTHIAPAAEELLPYLLHDKKRQDNQITVVYVEEIGTFELRQYMPEAVLQLLENLS